MSKRKRRWLIATGPIALTCVAAVLVAGRMLAKRVEPYIHEQAILYLRHRFDSEVELSALRVRMPNVSVVRLLLSRGEGALAKVEGDGLRMFHKGRRDIPA